MKFLNILLLSLCGIFAFSQTTEVLSPVDAVLDGTVSASGNLDASGTTLRVGDDSADDPLVAILSFDTSNLPDEALILGARLLLTPQVGTGDTSAFGLIRVDLRSGFFGPSQALEPEDFNAPADIPRAFSLTRGTPAMAILDASSRAAINLVGPTQFRLRFLDRSDNLTADQALFYSGDAATGRPELQITYATLEQPQTRVTLTLNPIGPSFSTASQTISGSVSPADALIFFEGDYLAQQPDGSFSLPITLNSGLNTFSFQGLAYTYLEHIARLELYLDTEAPIINITAPQQQLHTNASTLDVQGIVSDRLTPTLTREGQTITLTDNRFTDAGLALVQGENIFTWRATDNLGNSSEKRLTVYQNATAPTISLTAPDHIAAGATWTLSLSLTPQTDIEKVYVTINNQQVYEGLDGAPFQSQFTHAGAGRQVTIDVRVRDIYGNEAQAEKEISVAFVSYVEGRVLADATSLPLSGIPVKITSGYAPNTLLTTDSQGLFQGYVSGAPLDVQIDHPDYVPVLRHFADLNDGRRIPDLRLIPAAPASPAPFDFDDFRVSFGSGLSGPAQVTPFSGNSLPLLLPLGYAPVMGVSVRGSSGTGLLSLIENQLPLPQNGTLVALRSQDHSWRVEAVMVLDGTPVRADFADAGDGFWLVAILDTWSDIAPPQVGDLLQRLDDRLASIENVQHASPDPKRISIWEDPQTRLYVDLGTSGQVSGSRARVRVSEFHDRFDQAFNLEDDFLDLTFYAYYGSPQTRLLGQLDVHARATVDPDLTRSANLQFSCINANPFQAIIPANQQADLGILHLDFSQASSQTPAIRLETTFASDLPLASGSQALLAFDLWLGHELDRAPGLQLDAPLSQNVVLLRRIAEGQYVYAGRLSHNTNFWVNDPESMDLTASGRYVLVSLDAPLTLVTGQCLSGGSPSAGALVSGPNHPWFGQSDATGFYRWFVISENIPLEIKANQEQRREEDQRSLPLSWNQSQLSDQDFHLAAPLFQMVSHEPAPGTYYVSRLPRIYLAFSMALTLDKTNLAANISLKSPSGTTIPLQILQDRSAFALEILPQQTLIQDTTYTLSLATGLENFYGQGLTTAQEFDFHTQMEAVSGELDLSRFYLSESAGQLYIEAPADAYPPKTWLNTLNERTASSDSWLMPGGAYKQAIEGEVGDAIDLEATLPGGDRVRYRLDVVKTGSQSWRFGTSPFTLQLSSGQLIRIDEIENGFGREISFEPIALEDAQTLAATIPNLENGNLTAVEAIRITATDGLDLPDFSGRIPVSLPQSSEVLTFVSLAIQENVLFPAEPGGLEKIETDLVTLNDIMAVQNGRALSKRSKQGGQTRMEFASGNGNTYAIFSSRDVPVNYKVRSYRDPSPLIPAPLTPAPDWPDLPGVEHIPYTTVHLAFGNSWKPLGITDFRGNGKFIDYSGETQMAGTDPITGAVVSGLHFAVRELSDYWGIESIHKFAKRDLHFKKDSVALSQPLPRLSLAWDVLDADNQVLPQETQELREFSRVKTGVGKKLRATLRRLDGVIDSVLVKVNGTETGTQKRLTVSSLEVLLPETYLADAGLLEISLTAPETGELHSTLNARFLVLDANNSPIGPAPGPPVVIRSRPENNEKNVVVTTDIRIDFSEPVKDWRAGISLSSAGEVIPFTPMAANGLELAPTDLAATVYLRLDVTLKLDREYNLRVFAVKDQDNVVMDPQKPYQTRFRTANLPQADVLVSNEGYRYTSQRLQNLLLVSQFGYFASEVEFFLYDMRDPYNPEQLNHWQGFRNPSWLRQSMAIFLPEDLEEDAKSFQPSRTSDELRENLPDGTHIVLVGMDQSGAFQMSLFQVTGQEIEKLDTLDLIMSGIPRIEKAGAYLTIANGDLMTPGGTAVYDLREILKKRLELTQMRRTNLGQYRIEMASIKKTMYFSQPASPGGVDFLWRTRNDGQIKPTLLLPGWDYPGIFDFDPNLLPNFVPFNFGPRLDALDTRVLGLTQWPGSHISARVSSMERFAFTIKINGQPEYRVDDLAIFANGQNKVTLYPVPEQDQDPLTPIQPLITLTFPEKVKNVMADRYSGMLAIQLPNSRINFLDLRPLLAGQEKGAEVTIPNNSQFYLMDEPLTLAMTLDPRFEYGCIYGEASIGGGQAAVHIPVAPVRFRTAGFQYLDLADWRSKDGIDVPLALKHSQSMVYYATDRVKEGETEPQFVLEMGTYALTVYSEEKTTWSLHQETRKLAEIERKAEDHMTTQQFSLYGLAEDLALPERQEKLRDVGYLTYTIEVKTTIGDEKTFEKKVDFLVVYLPPDTDYLDPNRKMPGFDALSLQPDLLGFDHLFSSLDPRLSLSPGRAYNYRTAFQSGPFGVGMLDTRSLYMALPVWWTVSEIKPGWHDAKPVEPQLLLEQPGSFRLQGQIDENDTNGQVSFTNSLTSTFKKVADLWVLNHRQTAEFGLATGAALPKYRALFNQLNISLKETDDKPEERLAYPVFRHHSGENSLPRFMGEVREKDRIQQPWPNRLTLSTSDKKPTTTPQLITEKPADTSSVRFARMSYRNSLNGPVVATQILDSDGLTLRYLYDPEGYLKTVWIGERKIEYQWQSVAGLKLGDFIPKRLESIKVANETIKYYYAGDNKRIKLSGVSSTDVIREITATKNAGQVSSVTLSGVQEPDQTLTFALKDGLFLSSGYEFKKGTENGENLASYDLTWSKIKSGKASEWRITADSYLDQTMTYDTRGRLLTHSRVGGVTQSWTYATDEGPFWEVPNQISVPVDEGDLDTFTLAIDRNGILLSADGLSQKTTFTNSGTPGKTTSLNGFENGIDYSNFYSPVGGGFNSVGGRLTGALIPDKGLSAFSATYNKYGEPLTLTQMGVTTKILNYDDLGRPLQIESLNGVKQDIQYGVENGLTKVITTDSSSGLEITEKYNHQGQLITAIRKLGATPDGLTTSLYSYDLLGRLTEVKTNDQSVYTATYDSDFFTPSSLKTPTETTTISRDTANRITAISQQVEGQPSQEIPYTTDLQGRPTLFRVPDLGLMRTQYDAFGRMTRLYSDAQDPADENPQEITWTYELPRKVTVEDKIRQFSQTTTYTNNSGLDWTVATSGIGAGVSKEDRYETQISSRSIPGYALATSVTTIDKGYDWLPKIISSGSTEFQLPSPVKREQEQSSIKKVFFSDTLGNNLGFQYGKYSYKANNQFNRFGQPLGFDGMYDTSYTYDGFGRVTEKNQSGHSTHLAYDGLNRLTQTTDTRGKQATLNYLGQTGHASALEIDDETLWSRTNLSEADTTSILGASRAFRTTLPGEKFSVEKDGVKTVLEVDPNTSQLKSLTSYSGDQYHFSNLLGGRVSMVKPPLGETQVSESDIYGNLRFYSNGFLPKIGILRDAEQRITAVLTQERQYQFNYEGEDLTSIIGGEEPINFSEHNGIGLPERVEIGDRGSLEISYHANGNPSCIISKPQGGLPSTLRYNEFGDLTEIRRGLQETVSYTYNSWGTPDTMKLGNNQPLPLFQEGRNKQWNLPGGVKLDLDQEGRPEALLIPGLALKTMAYDAQDRLETVSIGGMPVENYAYNDGKLTAIQYVNGEMATSTTLAYDERGRIISASTTDSQVTAAPPTTKVSAGPGPHTSHWLYNMAPGGVHPDGDRVASYTDANGLVYHYEYDTWGNVRQIRLSDDGPIFNYVYDKAGNLLETSVDTMKAVYEGYHHGYPNTMTWSTVGTQKIFDINATAGRLYAIEERGPVNPSAGLSLTLAWDLAVPDNGQCPNEDSLLITRVTRQGPLFRETWQPDYDSEQKLAHTSIQRRYGSNLDGEPGTDYLSQTIEEDYKSLSHGLMGGLTRTINNDPQNPAAIPQTNLDLSNLSDITADDRRISSQTSPSGNALFLTDPLGDYTLESYGVGKEQAYQWDGQRRLRFLGPPQTPGVAGVDPQNLETEEYLYDHSQRRIGRYSNHGWGQLVYAWHGSKIIAIGYRPYLGQTQWTHAFGQGALGVAFVKDLTGSQKDKFIFPDHLGTPFAYYDPRSNQTSYTPYNPWGELLATSEEPRPRYKAQGEVPTWNFKKAEDPIFPSPPLGLGGHLYDHHTGLVYMHNRYYHPRLGHFLTADFRAPDIYDPSTVTEPYAYATGNPIMFWDPDGRRVIYLGQDSAGRGWMGILYTLDGAPQIALISRLEWELAMKGQGPPVGNMKFVGTDPDSFWERSEFLQYQLLQQIRDPRANIEILPDPYKNFQRNALIFTGGATVAPFAIGAMLLGLPAETTVAIATVHAGSLAIAAGTALPVAYLTDLSNGTSYTPEVIDALVEAGRVQIGHTLGHAMGAGLSGEGPAAWRNWKAAREAMQAVESTALRRLPLPENFGGGYVYQPPRALSSSVHPIYTRLDDVVTKFGGTYVQGGVQFPTKRAAQQAASEVLGNMGSDVSTIRMETFRGAPWKFNGSQKVTGKEVIDPITEHSILGFRDDFLGHHFGDGTYIPPHINVWYKDLLELHFFY